MYIKIVVTEKPFNPDDDDDTTINYVQTDDIERIEFRADDKIYIYFKAHGISCRLSDEGVQQLVDQIDEWARKTKPHEQEKQASDLPF